MLQAFETLRWSIRMRLDDHWKLMQLIELSNRSNLNILIF